MELLVAWYKRTQYRAETMCAAARAANPCCCTHCFCAVLSTLFFTYRDCTEQPQVNCLGQDPGALVVGMEVVTAVVSREKARWNAGVLHRLVEIDHCVECLAGTNPGINCLALHLHIQRRTFVASEWQNGATEYFEPTPVSAC